VQGGLLPGPRRGDLAPLFRHHQAEGVGALGQTERGTVAGADANAASYWKDFSVPWALWNHVRTLGAILAFLCLLGAWAVDLTSAGRRSYGLR